jgi:hypothetical protein
MIITLVFVKNANFFAENCQKSKKIVIITSVPAFIVPEVQFGNCSLKKQPQARDAAW